MKKRCILLCFTCLLTGMVYAQQASTNKVKPKSKKAIPEVVEVEVEKERIFPYTKTEAQFPFKKGFVEFIEEYADYPIDHPIDGKRKIQGEVIVSFIVRSDGRISDVKVEKSVNPLLDKEAIRIVSKVSRWVPATENGQCVPYPIKVAINFELHDLYGAPLETENIGTAVNPEPQTDMLKAKVVRQYIITYN